MVDMLHVPYKGNGPAMADPKVRGTLDSIGTEPIGSSPEALRDHLAKETMLWARLVKERNIKIQ